MSPGMCLECNQMIWCMYWCTALEMFSLLHSCMCNIFHLDHTGPSHPFSSTCPASPQDSITTPALCAPLWLFIYLLWTLNCCWPQLFLAFVRFLYPYGRPEYFHFEFLHVASIQSNLGSIAYWFTCFQLVVRGMLLLEAVWLVVTSQLPN